jgi:MFS family permease
MLGGLTATYASWRLAFIIIAILAAIVAAVSWLFTEDSRSPEGRSLDIPGQVTVGLGLFALLYAVTVVGMFSFLGTAYAISIWMEVIQHQAAIRTAVAFILLSSLAIFLLPLTSLMIARLQRRWVLSLGFLLMGLGQLLASGMSITDTGLPSLILPMGLVGVGFAFAVSSVTSTVVNTVPPKLAGMAAAATSMVRDFGFALGAALIGAIAVTALSSGYSTGFLVVAIAALACAIATALFLGGRTEQEQEIATIEHGEDAAVA